VEIAVSTLIMIRIVGHSDHIFWFTTYYGLITTHFRLQCCPSFKLPYLMT